MSLMSIKRLVAAGMVIVVLLALTGGTVANAAPPRQDGTGRTITVTGYGTAYGVPDVVVVGLGVEALNPDIKAAMDDTTQRLNAVIAVLSANGVASDDIRTEHFSIYQDYGYYGPGMEGGEAQQPNYRVSSGLTVTVRNVDMVGELLAAAVDAGANMVNYLQFDIEDRNALQDEARSLAVADAKARADHLAGLLGMAVGEALSVTEGGDYYSPMPYMGGGGGGALDTAAPPISQGTLSVNGTVTVTFALVAPAS